jgi:hypothetical protein
VKKYSKYLYGFVDETIHELKGKRKAKKKHQTSQEKVTETIKQSDEKSSKFQDQTKSFRQNANLEKTRFYINEIETLIQEEDDDV